MHILKLPYRLHAVNSLRERLLAYRIRAVRQDFEVYTSVRG